MNKKNLFKFFLTFLLFLASFSYSLADDIEQESRSTIQEWTDAQEFVGIIQKNLEVYNLKLTMSFPDLWWSKDYKYTYIFEKKGKIFAFAALFISDPNDSKLFPFKIQLRNGNNIAQGKAKTPEELTKIIIKAFEQL